MLKELYIYLNLFASNLFLYCFILKEKKVRFLMLP